MNQFVLDASAAFEYLARTPIGLKIDLFIQGELTDYRRIDGC